MRTFTTKKGLIINTDLADDDAIRVCATLTNSRFAIDLVYKHSHGGLTTEQMAWVHKLALEATGKSDQITSDANKVDGFLAINRLFAGAIQTIENPGMKLLMRKGEATMGESAGLYLHLAIQPILTLGRGDAPNSTNPNQIKLMVGAFDYTWGDPHYAGRIDKHGVLYEGGACTKEIVQYLRSLGKDPSLVLGNSGRLSGHCPMCGQANNSPESEAHGYGPTCARTWGLEWADAKA